MNCCRHRVYISNTFYLTFISYWGHNFGKNKMEKETVVWITRHGEREDVVDRQWYTKPQRSYDDPPLAEKGILGH